MSTLTNYLFENAKKTPTKEAIWCDGKTATYQEFSDMTVQIANLLLKIGVKPGDAIGVPMNNSIESVALFFAAAEIGAALAPINPTLPASAIETAFGSVNIRCIIARKSFLNHYKPDGIICVCQDSEVEGAIAFASYKEQSKQRPNIGVDDNSTIILTLTSGSTGEPKPIELSQQNKIDRAFEHAKVYHLSSEDRILAATPLYHSLAERLVIMPLILGATAILLPRFTPNIWLNCISEQKVTFTIAVSAQLSQVSQLLSSPFLPNIDSMRCMVSSSSYLEPHVKKELINKLHCEFHEMYGTSEVSTVTDINFADAEGKGKSVGKTFDCATIRIIDDNEKELSTGEIGEITCKTKLAFKGYYNLPEKTAASYTKDGFFHTGDLGYLDQDGYLYFSGRKKELIITGGINVYPIDVENVIKNIEGVEEVAAFSYPDERLGEVVAVAIVKNKEELTAKQIQLHCVRNLADFQQPHKIFFLKELPKNAMGKLTKGKLLEAVKMNGETDE